MSKDPSDIPSPDDVRRQLDRMQASDVFVSAPRLSPMLAYIVEQSLADDGAERLSEHEIGYALFENYDPDGSVVRTNATFLRGRISKYYLECGDDDLVKIEVPAGGYRARFSYNRRTPAEKYYRRAWARLGNFEVSESPSAFFCQAIKADPRHAPSYAAKAEAKIWEAMYRRSIPPHNAVVEAVSAARKALELQPQLWRAHVAMAASHCCRCEWDLAQLEFSDALAIAPGSVQHHPWYHTFLLATGRESEALKLARARVDDRPGDLSARLALAYLLYLARDLIEAEEMVSEAVSSFRTNWLALVVYACIALAKGDGTGAARRIEDAEEILWDRQVNYDTDTLVFPGLLCLCRSLRDSEGDKESVRARMAQIANEDDRAIYEEARWSRGDFKGEQAEKRRGSLDKAISYWPPMQLALGKLAIDDADSAVDLLGRAMEEGDPLTVCLHVSPVFDALRDHSGFRKLIQRMKLPRSSGSL